MMEYVLIANKNILPDLTVIKFSNLQAIYSDSSAVTTNGATPIQDSLSQSLVLLTDGSQYENCYSYYFLMEISFKKGQVRFQSFH